MRRYLDFDFPPMHKLATEEFITEKVFKYLLSFDYNCRNSKTYVYHKFL